MSPRRASDAKHGGAVAVGKPGGSEDVGHRGAGLRRVRGGDEFGEVSAADARPGIAQIWRAFRFHGRPTAAVAIRAIQLAQQNAAGEFRRLVVPHAGHDRRGMGELSGGEAEREGGEKASGHGRS